MKANNFESRPKFSLAEAIEHYDMLRGWIGHILDNQDGTFSIMTHINCEHCDYCDEDNRWYSEGLQGNALCHKAHIAKPDPYEEQKKRFPENYGLA